MPTRATLRIIPTPERRLLLRESLAAAVAAAAAAAERRGHGGVNGASAADGSAQGPAQDAAEAGTAGPLGGGEFVERGQARLHTHPSLLRVSLVIAPGSRQCLSHETQERQLNTDRIKSDA